MSCFPLNFDLRGRLCVVVGGGAVGRRKVQALQAAGARVRLVTPVAGEEPGLAGVEIVIRPYRRGDLEGAFLVFAATDDRQVNAAVVRDARQTGIPVNVADVPEEGDFTLPAVLRRGDLAVAVSTGARSPALAAVVRDRLALALGPEWAVVVEIAGALREKKLTHPEKTEYNQEILCRLLERGLPALIAGRQTAGIDRFLEELFGGDCSLAALGIRLPKGET